jgi:mRNA-degrading endonuclease RelE of RelBE toxin-antitoxin system
MTWKIGITNKASKQLKKLSESVRSAYVTLVKEMEIYGPYRTNWKHYGKLKNAGECYHCHIISGKPTYVVCWEITDKKIKILEVYYVGTHENAPY